MDAQILASAVAVAGTMVGALIGALIQRDAKKMTALQ